MENQQSMTLAREADPSGKRTIGKSLIVQYDLMTEEMSRRSYEA